MTDRSPTPPRAPGAPSRRDFLKGAAAGAVLPGAVLEAVAAGGSSPRRRWPGYEEALVVDALAGVGWFNVPPPGGEPSEDAMAEAVRASGIDAINLTVGVVGNRPDPFEATVEEIARWEGRIARRPDVYRKARTAADVRDAAEEGRMAVVYGFQDAVALEGRVERLDLFHDLGVRILQLTYNDRNRLGDGCLEPANAGLSRLGHAVVERMGELGMLVDLSHCGDRTTADAVEAAAGPVAVTHTGCRAVYDHPRNKPDPTLRRVAERGGVVGVYLMPFLNPAGPPTAADVLDHLEHALDVCGEDHVGIGSDQAVVPVDASDAYRELVARVSADRARRGIGAPRETTAPFVPELNHPRRLEAVADGLAARGHPARVVEKVLGSNWVRLFDEVWGG